MMQHVSPMKKEYLKQWMRMVPLIITEEVSKITMYLLQAFIGELLGLMETEVFV